MFKGYRKVVAVALAAGLIAVGCNTVEGGGWLLSATGVGKATFGFSLTCENDEVSGDLQYQDKAAGVRFHGTPDSTGLSTLCGGTDDGWFFGEYTPQPPVDKNGNVREGGRFEIIVTDTGQNGRDKGDMFTIRLSGGVFDGYTNSGVIQGGNITLVQ